MGTAQNVVACLALTSAVELLQARFGNRQIVISSHMELLTRIPKNTVESHVRGLERMEISPDMYGCFLTPIIMQKLPEESRIAITCNLGSKTWNLKVILSEFHK